MNWYTSIKIANDVKKKIKSFLDKRSSDILAAWIKGNEVFLSCGDWCEDPQGRMKELQESIGNKYYIDCDAEVGYPDDNPNWEEIKKSELV